MISDQRLLASVVVPTYNRPDLLQRCLTALLQQTLAHDAYEILVCDDGPSAAARQVVDAAIARTNGAPAIRYCPVTATQGPAGARNVGWRTARAPIIAFTDDDTVPEPGWLQAGLDAMSSGVEAAVGRTVMPIPDKPTDYEKDAARLEQAEFITANCFLRVDALAAVGGFDERFTLAWREDSDLHFSLLEKGYSVVAAPGAIVVHPVRPVKFAAGLGMQRKMMFDVLLYRKFPALYRQRIRQGPPWFYSMVSFSLLAALCCALAGWHRAAAWAFALWAVLTLCFFFKRLRLTAMTPRNVGDVFVTSLLIPPLSLFWRAVGAARFGRAFP